MLKKRTWLLAAIFAFICGACVTTSCSNDDDTAISPTDDSSQFVNVTDMVPDAILEIRYY